MSSYKFTSFQVRRYRSLLDVKIDINDSSPIVICGENNIGKTNFLRALNVFFNAPFQEEIYIPKNDIPHHIFYGSQGAGANTELIGTFKKDEILISLKIKFSNNGEASYYIDSKVVTDEVAKEYLSYFNFLYVESHNIDIPKLISVVLEKDGLLPLDTKRKKQSEPLEKLTEFIELSQKAIKDIENNINECFKKLTDFDGILRNQEIRIHFAEFEKLRDVVKTMTSITLYDGNSHGIAYKGSGAQRAVFLALIQFISQNTKKNIIWGIDEPEAFLQPKLQKKVSEVLRDIVLQRKQPMLITTHSQHFVNLNNLKTTYIFKGNISKREYIRKPNQVFFEVNAAPIDCKSDFEKASLIKQHLGISNNDGWEVLPYNILVEGEEDKKYFETLFNIVNLPVPNIVWSGGASKIAGYLQYYNQFARDLPYKPEFVCLFDNDIEGKEQSKKIRPKSYSFINSKIIDLPRYDGLIPSSSLNSEWEIEDFLPPEIMFAAINQILKKEKYKQVSKIQIKNRNQPAHVGKQILKYADECSNQNNSDKDPFNIDTEGRKKQICLEFCDLIRCSDPKKILTDEQIRFIKQLVK